MIADLGSKQNSNKKTNSRRSNVAPVAGATAADHPASGGLGDDGAVGRLGGERRWSRWPKDGRRR